MSSFFTKENHCAPVAKLLVYMGIGMTLLKQRMGVGQGYIYAKILKMKIKIKHNKNFCKSAMIDLRLNSSLKSFKPFRLHNQTFPIQ